jgi:predicted membrane-bound spermidine synthase
MVSLGFRVEKTLFSGQSPFQKVDIVKTAGHGNMLLNDGIVMLSEKDEFVYHEMIAHVPNVSCIRIRAGSSSSEAATAERRGKCSSTKT